MINDLFRENALKKMSSPDELDQLMKITKPMSWISVVIIGLIILIALLWAVFGTLQTKVNAPGILISEEGVFNVVTIGSGQIINIIPSVGDNVKKGDIVAVIHQPELEVKLNNAKQNLLRTRQLYNDNIEYLNEYELTNIRIYNDQKKDVEKTIDILNKRIDYLSQKEISVKKLVEQELVIDQQLFQVRQELSSAKQELSNATNRLSQINMQKEVLLADVKQKTQQSYLELNKIEQAECELDSQYRIVSEVRSLKDGEVIEINTYPGKIVNSGAPILKLLVNQADKDAFIFVSPDEGKKIIPGMQVNIAPSNIRSEEYGFIIGKVSNVSFFPSSPDNLMSLLENESLVKMFSQSGPPIIVVADLIPDSMTFSKLKWTSSKGPKIKITDGTLCNCGIIVEQKSPISLLLVNLQKQLGL